MANPHSTSNTTLVCEKCKKPYKYAGALFNHLEQCNGIWKDNPRNSKKKKLHLARTFSKISPFLIKISKKIHHKNPRQTLLF